MRRWWMAVLLCAGCAGETPGRVVQVRWQFERGSRADHRQFSTETGWEVTLEQARLGIAAIYAFAPAADKQAAVAWLERAFVAKAHAHGGLDAESGRRIRAELLETVVVDLLDSEPLTLPRTEAEAGALDGLKLELVASSPELAGAAVRVRGEAKRGEQHVRFDAPIVWSAGAKARSVELTGFAAAIDEGVELRLHIDPSVWFKHCEFDRLTPSAADELLTVGADNQVGRALLIGVRSPEAFEFSVREGE